MKFTINIQIWREPQRKWMINLRRLNQCWTITNLSFIRIRQVSSKTMTASSRSEMKLKRSSMINSISSKELRCKSMRLSCKRLTSTQLVNPRFLKKMLSSSMNNKPLKLKRRKPRLQRLELNNLLLLKTPFKI